MKNSSGVFIVFEGLDGCGKSTQARLLAEHLRAQGTSVVLTKEPTEEGDAGKEIRRVLHHEKEVSPLEFQKLFAEDRRLHVEQIVVPALARGEIIISDRYFFSSFAYGAGAGGCDIEEIVRLNDAFLFPALAFILKVAPEECMRRLGKRGDMPTYFEKLTALQKTWGVYETFPARFGRSVMVIDGERPQDAVFSDIKNRVRELIEE